MRERARNRNVLGQPGPGGLGDIFPADGASAPLVTVAHGPYFERLPVGDMNVGEIRARYRDRFDIDPRSLAVLDGNTVGNDTIVRAGQVLTFVRRSGEKGARTAASAVRGR
jgi:hypothetical protein